MNKNKITTDKILCYNSRKRYKLKIDNINKKITLKKLNNNLDDDLNWSEFEKFSCENMSEKSIIQKAQQLIELWDNEPKNNIHHITDLNYN